MAPLARSTLAGAAPDELADLLTSPSLDGWDLGLALAVVLVGSLVALYAGRATTRVLRNVTGLPESLRRLTARIVRVFLVVLSIGVSLVVLGVEIRPVLAATVLIAVAGAVALRGIAENFSAGLVLQARQPVRPGDVATVAGYDGTVRDIGGRTLIMETFDGLVVHVPNRTVLDEPIVNGSARGARRSTLEARWRSATPDADLRTLATTMATVDGLLTDPSPTIQTVARDADRTTVHVRFWSRPNDLIVVADRAVCAVAAALAPIDPDRTVIAPPPPPPFTPPARH